MKKRKKTKKERRDERPVAASLKRALAGRWAALAEELASSSGGEARERLASEARSLAGEEGGPQAFGEAFKRASASEAESLLELAAASGAGSLAGALEKLIGGALPAGLALRALGALEACGGEPGVARVESCRLAVEAATGLVETLDATGEPEAIGEAAAPLEELQAPLAVSALMEVFSRLSPDGWMGASRLAGRSASLDEALAEALGSVALPGAEAVPLLRRLAAAEAKATSKAARALIHKLKSRGVAVDEEAPGAVWSPPQAEAEPAEALITGFDQSGHRMVWLALPAPPRGLHVGYAIVSDSQGLVSFSWGTLSRKQLEEAKEELAAEHAKRQIPLVAAEPAEAKRKVSRAAALAEKAGRRVPEEFRDFESRHPAAEAGEDRTVYKVMSDAALERARHSTAASPELLDDPQGAVAFWRLEASEVERALEPAEQRGLIVTPTTSKVAEAGEIKAACDRLFSGELFERLLERFEEQALVFWADGQHDRAGLCMACVLPFRDDPLMRPSDHPFWVRWAERLFHAQRASSQREGAEGRLILTPEEAAAEAQAARRRFGPGRHRKG